MPDYEESDDDNSSSEQPPPQQHQQQAQNEQQRPVIAQPLREQPMLQDPAALQREVNSQAMQNMMNVLAQAAQAHVAEAARLQAMALQLQAGTNANSAATCGAPFIGSQLQFSGMDSGKAEQPQAAANVFASFLSQQLARQQEVGAAAQVGAAASELSSNSGGATLLPPAQAHQRQVAPPARPTGISRELQSEPVQIVQGTLRSSLPFEASHPEDLRRQSPSMQSNGARPEAVRSGRLKRGSGRVAPPAIGSTHEKRVQEVPSRQAVVMAASVIQCSSGEPTCSDGEPGQLTGGTGSTTTPASAAPGADPMEVPSQALPPQAVVVAGSFGHGLPFAESGFVVKNTFFELPDEETDRKVLRSVQTQPGRLDLLSPDWE